MNDRETSLYPIALPWWKYAGLLLVSLVLGGALFFLRSSHSMVVDVLIDSFGVLYALFLALVCVREMRRLRPRPRAPGADTQGARRFIPVLLGMGMGCAALGLLAWMVEGIRIQQFPTFPAWPRFLLFGAYCFFIAALLLLPAQNLSRLSRLRILLDSLIVLTTVATLYGYYLLVPILASAPGNLLARSVASLFPAADLVLLFCVLLVGLRPAPPVLLRVVLLLGLAVAILLVGHTVSLVRVLAAQSSLTLRPNPGWPVSFALITVAAHLMSHMLDEGAGGAPGPVVLLEETGLPARWKTFLSYAVVLVFALLIVSLWLSSEQEHMHARLLVVDIGGTLLLLLVVVRQFFAMHEMTSLKHELRAKNAQLARLAASDPLTGVLNHQTLGERLDEALVCARQEERPCSVLFLDIDHFKELNDQYGHQVGDRVLCQFARLATSLLGPADAFGRWGGEEFVVVLPGKEQAEAYTVAEQIRRRVASQVFAGEARLSVTCSLGVATSPSDAAERERLIACADQAMYLAKRLGRNQVSLTHEREGRAF